MRAARKCAARTCFGLRNLALSTSGAVDYSLWMSIQKARGKLTRPEPKPGEWIKPSEFANIVRLTPLVAIDLVVRSPEGRILVGRRTNEPAKNLLFVPGSRISKNETRAVAFKRITREELGVELGIET